MKPTSVVLLTAGGGGDLWLIGVTRHEDGSVKAGDVVNGAWRFERRDGEVLAKSSNYIVNRWPDPGYTEVPAPKGRDYNDVINQARNEHCKNLHPR